MTYTNISKLLISTTMLAFSVVSHATVYDFNFSAADKESFNGDRKSIQSNSFVNEKNSHDDSFNNSAGYTKLDQNSHDEKIKKESKNAGQYSAIASTVPEPETYSMILIGLALIGITTRRRHPDVQ